jgi:hypothetical protein
MSLEERMHRALLYKIHSREPLSGEDLPFLAAIARRPALLDLAIDQAAPHANAP